MTAVSIPAFSLQYDLATALDYKSKHHFINTSAKNGGAMFQAVVLMYDDIQRVQTGPEKYFNSSELDTFIFHEFENNSIWFMDELVGIESDWKKHASNDDSTAYGYVQFTEASVQTAVNRYRYHIDKFNSRSILGRRDWQPHGYINAELLLGGTKMKYPEWLIKIETALTGDLISLGSNPYYVHKKDLSELTYDQMLALAFVHLHREDSKDYNFVQLAKGDLKAAKALYENNHHTNAGDKKTQARIALFFKLH